MKNQFVTLLLMLMLISFFNLSCSFNKNKEDVTMLLKSNNLSDKMNAYYIIGENRDANYIDSLLTNLDDPRISNNLRYKGMSIYQCKIEALKKISKKNPPNEINNRPDSTNIKYYLSWASHR